MCVCVQLFTRDHCARQWLLAFFSNRAVNTQWWQLRGVCVDSFFLYIFFFFRLRGGLGAGGFCGVCCLAFAAHFLRMEEMSGASAIEVECFL